MDVKKKNILILGGAGFIGSHLYDYFMNEECNVVVIDNMITGSEDNLPKNATIIKEDISKRSMHSFFSQPMIFDEVWNCACPASPVAYRNHPIETLDTCYLGTKNALEFARNNNAKYVHLSTSEVYGDSAKMSEYDKGSVNCFGPRACYDEGKRVAETLCYEYIVKYDMDIRVFRLFNTFGPRMAWNDGRVVPNFIMAALFGKDIPIYQDAFKTRTFNYVNDTVMMMIKASKESYRHPLNISTTANYMTLHELAIIIRKLASSHSKIVKLDNEVGDDPTNRYPMITQLESVIGKYYAEPFEDSMKKTIEYFKYIIATHEDIKDVIESSPKLFTTYVTPHFK